ncbi:MAG: hypothetical protein V4724_31005 [Pseudomonadota bacterium]
MNNASDTQLLWEQHLATCGWHIAGTVALGVLAACLGLFGQHCLLQARPIFPLIDQNFALWQSGYVLILLVIGVVWTAAVLQKISYFQDCLQRIKLQRQLDERNEARARRAEEEKREQQQAMAAAMPLRHGGRSRKFDY